LGSLVFVDAVTSAVSKSPTVTNMRDPTNDDDDPM